MLLYLDGVTKKFGEFTVIDNLSFEIEQGDVFGIAGPNGAGKTTLFNVITGIYSAQGKILFRDHPIHGLPPHRICHHGIARTFQMPTLFGSMDVATNIRVGAHFGKIKVHNESTVIDEMLEFTGLAEQSGKPVSGLKIYEKKLAMLAAALATKPRLLLLDEPVGGLSPLEADDFIGLGNKINKKLGITLDRKSFV